MSYGITLHRSLACRIARHRGSHRPTPERSVSGDNRHGVVSVMTIILRRHHLAHHSACFGRGTHYFGDLLSSGKRGSME